MKFFRFLRKLFSSEKKDKACKHVYGEPFSYDMPPTPPDWKMERVIVRPCVKCGKWVNV